MVAPAYNHCISSDIRQPEYDAELPSGHVGQGGPDVG
jgi:hypothetical protein